MSRTNINNYFKDVFFKSENKHGTSKISYFLSDNFQRKEIHSPRLLNKRQATTNAGRANYEKQTEL